MTRAAENLVQLNRPTPRAGKVSCLLQGPLVHHFFLAGILCGFIGTTYLGAHMWLILNGQIAPRMSYPALKELHALLQVYGFLGLFILGFLLQSAPKVFGGKTLINRSAILIIPGVVCGIVALLLFSHLIIGRVLLALAFSAALTFLLPPLLHSSPARLISVGIPSIQGLLVLVAGTFLPLDVPTNALLIVWGGIVAVILGASQQFIAGALGGKRMSLQAGILLAALLLSSTLALGLGVFRGITAANFWMLVSALCTGTLLVHAAASGVIGIFKFPFDSLSFALATGLLWALIATLGLSHGAAYSDLVLHTLLTGLAVPLIIAVSSRIIGFLSGVQALSDRSLLLLIALWQCVPLFRGLVGHTIDPRLSWLVITVASIVFIIWPWALLRGIWALYQRQFMLRRDEKMMQC